MKLIRWVATALLVLYVWFTPVWLCFESWHLWSIQISPFGIFMFLVSCFDSDAIPAWKQCYDCFYSHLFCWVFMLYFLYIFTHTVVQHAFCVRWYSYRWSIARRVPHVNQVLLTVQELEFTTVFLVLVILFLFSL